MKKTMLWAFPAACLVVFCAGAGAVGMDIPLPKLKYEETSVEQDRLVRAARRLDEQTPAEAQAAVEALLADPSTPAPLRGWAAARKYEHLVGPCHNREALEFGRAWLRDHPDDPHAIIWRRTMQQVAITFICEGEERDLAAIVETSEDLFNHHPATAWEVIYGRFDYAHILKGVFSLFLPGARAEAERQRGLALEALHTLAEAPESAPEDRERAVKHLEGMKQSEEKRQAEAEIRREEVNAYREKSKAYIQDLDSMTPEEAVRRRAELEALLGSPLPSTVPKAASEAKEDTANGQ